MPLNQNRIDLVSNWKSECNGLSKQHNLRALHLKRKYQIFGMLQLLIPVGFTLANQIIGVDNTVTIMASVGFSLTGITTIVLNFLNFKVLSTKHELAGNSYNTVINDIETTMSRHLSPPDMLVEKWKNELKNLQNYSPSLDDTCCCFCDTKLNS